RLGTGHVGGKRGNRAERRQRCGRLAQARLVDVGEEDARPLAQESLGDGAAHAARAAGDQHGSVVEAGHGNSSSAGRGAQPSPSGGPLYSWMMLPPSTTMSWPVT